MGIDRRSTGPSGTLSPDARPCRGNELNSPGGTLNSVLAATVPRFGAGQHGKAFHLTPVDQFADDQARFDRFADSNIVCNQKADRVEF